MRVINNMLLNFILDVFYCLMSWLKEQERNINNVQLIEQSVFFNKIYYVLHHPQSLLFRDGPANHYLEIGWKFSYNPSRAFSTAKYLEHYVDVHLCSFCPLFHYEYMGKKEKRIAFSIYEEFSIYLPEYSKKEPFIEKKYSIVKDQIITKKSNIPLSKTNKKTILIGTHELSYTGAPMLLLSVAKIYKSQNYNVIIVSYVDGDLKKEFIELGCNVLISDDYFKGFGFAFEFIKKENICFCIFNTIICLKSFNFFESIYPSILWIQENITEEIGKFTIYGEKSNNTMHCSKNIYFPCVQTMSFLSKYNDAFKILRYPIPDRCIDFKIKNVCSDLFVFAVVGSLCCRKGQDILLNAFFKLPKSLQNKCELRFYGSEYEPEYANSLYDRCKGIPQIKFYKEIQSKNDYYNLYKDITVLVCPSRQDPYPLVVIDGLMYGCPVIISENVGEKDIISSKNGFIFKNEDDVQLSQIMQNIVNNPNAINDMSIESRNVFLNNFNFDNTKQVFLDLIDSTKITN